MHNIVLSLHIQFSLENCSSWQYSLPPYLQRLGTGDIHKSINKDPIVPMPPNFSDAERAFFKEM